MQKRTWFGTAFIMTILIVFSGCWDSGGSHGNGIKILMVADGEYDDNSFNQSCREGLERAVQDYGVRADYQIIDDADTVEPETMLDRYDPDDYDLVIANGFFFAGAVDHAAADFPDTDFVIVDYAYEQVPANVNCVVFNADEAAFALGYLGGAWAEIQDPEDPVIAYVGGTDIPPVRQWTEPYCNGADHYNTAHDSDVACRGDFSTDFYDETQGEQIAGNLIADGADVIFGCGGLAGNAALEAAKDSGVWGIGVDRDMYEGLPAVRDIILSSGIKRFDNGVYAAVESVVNDEFDGGGIYRGNLQNSGVMLAPYHDYEDDIPADIKDEIEDIIEGIKDGAIDTGW